MSDEEMIQQLLEYVDELLEMIEELTRETEVEEWPGPSRRSER